MVGVKISTNKTIPNKTITNKFRTSSANFFPSFLLFTFARYRCLWVFYVLKSRNVQQNVTPAQQKRLIKMIETLGPTAIKLG